MTSVEQSQRDFVLYMIRLAPDSPACRLAIRVFSQAKFRKKSCKNPKFTFRKSEKNRGSFLPHEGMFHAVAFPFKQ